MQLQQTVKSFIRPGEQSGYVAECLEISIVTQGDTLDEVVQIILFHLMDYQSDFHTVQPSMFGSDSELKIDSKHCKNGSFYSQYSEIMSDL